MDDPKPSIPQNRFHVGSSHFLLKSINAILFI